MQNYQKWNKWKKTTSARYIFDWEEKQFYSVLPEICGTSAIQIGVPELFALKFCTTLNKILVLDSVSPNIYSSFEKNENQKNHFCEDSYVFSNFVNLPFANDSIHLVILPHILEMYNNPHKLLYEAARIIEPGGYIVLTGFNPHSLWNIGKGLLNLGAKFGVASNWQAISFYRLKDWLKLLDFELYIAKFGCYRPPFLNLYSHNKFTFIELMGERWWPIFGAVFFIVAFKAKNICKFVGYSRTSFVPAFLI